MDERHDHTRNFLSYLSSSGIAASAPSGDLSLQCRDGVIAVQGLVLAATSAMISEALGYSWAEEGQVLVLPDIRLDQMRRILEKVLTWSEDAPTIEEADADIMRMLHMDFLSGGQSSAVVAKAGGDRDLKCADCKKTFSSRKLLRRHEQAVHAWDNPHTCMVCDHPCRSSSELVIHTRVHTKEKPHACLQCSKRFAQVSQLNDHLNKVHDPVKNSTSCDICGLEMGSRAAVRRHVKIHVKPNTFVDEEEEENNDADPEDVTVTESKSEPRPKTRGPKSLKCDHCDKVLSTSYSLKLHQAVHLKSRPFACRQCGKKFSQNSHLTVHERIHTGVKPHMCPKCGKRFAAVSNMKKHCQIHEKEVDEAILDDTLKGNLLVSAKGTFACNLCDKVTSNSYDLIEHQKSHTDLQCHECSEDFATEEDLKAHRQKVHPHEFSCPHCHRVCSGRSNLDKHVLTHTGVRPHECQICQKRFSQKSHLNHHVRTVHAPPGDRARNHFCPECGQGFTSSSSLLKHRRRHTNERPFNCEFCDQSFIQKVHLQTHALKHTGEKPFLCGTCGKSFGAKSNLKEHIKIHSGEKKVHFCTECDSQYINLVDLRVHLRRHSGEAPFACDVCGKAFRAKRHLADHVRTHTGQKPFHCRNCSKSFAASGGLRLHFTRNDTCRLASTSGAFALSESEVMKTLDDVSVLDPYVGAVEFAVKKSVLVDFTPVLLDSNVIDMNAAQNPGSHLTLSVMDTDETTTSNLMLQQESEALTFSLPVGHVESYEILNKKDDSEETIPII